MNSNRHGITEMLGLRTVWISRLEIVLKRTHGVMCFRYVSGQFTPTLTIIRAAQTCRGLGWTEAAVTISGAFATNAFNSTLHARRDRSRTNRMKANTVIISQTVFVVLA